MESEPLLDCCQGFSPRAQRLAASKMESVTMAENSRCVYIRAQRLAASKMESVVFVKCQPVAENVLNALRHRRWNQTHGYFVGNA